MEKNCSKICNFLVICASLKALVFISSWFPDYSDSDYKTLGYSLLKNSRCLLVNRVDSLRKLLNSVRKGPPRFGTLVKKILFFLISSEKILYFAENSLTTVYSNSNCLIKKLLVLFSVPWPPPKILLLLIMAGGLHLNLKMVRE